jgi:hypothetical protein
MYKISCLFPWLRSYQSISPGPRHMYSFRNKAILYGEELLATRATPKLEDYILSPVRDCLFKIFATTIHTGGRSSIRNMRTRHDVVIGTPLSWETVGKQDEDIYINTRVFIYLFMHACMYVCMHVCIFVCMYACMYLCMCMYVCM